MSAKDREGHTEIVVEPDRQSKRQRNRQKKKRWTEGMGTQSGTTKRDKTGQKMGASTISALCL